MCLAQTYNCLLSVFAVWNISRYTALRLSESAVRISSNSDIKSGPASGCMVGFINTSNIFNNFLT